MLAERRRCQAGQSVTGFCLIKRAAITPPRSKSNAMQKPGHQCGKIGIYQPTHLSPLKLKH
jgi:hypothetical protein